jgi:GPH family glycoside/pentoside/hexuronide:cation symporter
MFTEPDKRNKAASYSSTFGSLGSLFAIDLFFAMVVVFGGGNDKRGYILTVIMLSVLAFFMLIGGFFTVREVVPLSKSSISFKKSLITVFENKHLMIAILIQISSLGISAYGILLPYFSKWNLADSFSFGAFSVESVLIPILSTATGVVYMIAVVVTPYLLKYFTKRKLLISMSVVGVILNVISVLCGFKNLYLFVGIRILAHIPPTITSTIAGYMIMDCLDYSEYMVGRRTEGSTYAVNNLIMKIGNAVFSSTVMLILGLVGYNAAITEPALRIGESITHNYSGMLNGIFLLMTVLPGISMLLQIIPISLYKLDEKKLNEIVEELKLRRQNETAAPAPATEGGSV